MVRFLFAVCVLCFTSASAHATAQIPDVIVNAFLSTPLYGTINDLQAGHHQQVYVAGFDPDDAERSSVVLLKLDHLLHIVWRKKFEAVPASRLTIAFSKTMGLYVVLPIKSIEENVVEIWVLEIDPIDGNTLQTMLVDKVESYEESSMKAFVATGETEWPSIYISYVELRGQRKETITTVVKVQKLDLGVLVEAWRVDLYNASRSVVSNEIDEDISEGRILVAQISRHPSSDSTDWNSITTISTNGTLFHTYFLPTASGNAKISSLATDASGLMYFAEAPTHIHQLSILSLNGTHRISKVWSQPAKDVLSVHVLRNGSLLYVLSKTEGVRNDNGTLVPASIPEFSVYSETGSVLMKKKHDDTIPGVERHIHLFHMFNEAISPKVVLGGYYRLLNSEGPERAELALGTYIYPISVVPEEQSAETPEPSLPKKETIEPGGTENISRVALAMALGILLVIALVVIVWVIKWRRSVSYLKEAERNVVDADELDVEA
ncbi:hypothetical protein BWQ96_04252 [Gracilariopsis chorda]|uniref:ER membrane protein complex subunit 1 n=1 Tax=Gracilariopsis chorda TaxID=448386 RepID=A0A2V3IV28_9FLOR|nr:hypothetical protein BWQ96_04252 [Gracilariopsis chorda]|eukprot:PXF45996.1 hypothetical protein BWQ96_04252 [Gracilariopsis chorda]